MKAHLKIIETKKEYKRVLKNFQTLFHAKANSEEEKEAKRLAILIEGYENKHFQIPQPNRI